MPASLRAAYVSFSSNRARFRNTWALAAMENAFLKDIGTSRVEIHFPVRNFEDPFSDQEMLRKAHERAS
jgi:uncharacterized protein YjiS (DUF1127 family)